MKKMLMVLMAGPRNQGPAFFDQLLLILIIFSIFYLIVFRPMRKKQKDMERMLSALKNGDRVVTSGGIYGTVVGVAGDIIQLRVAEQVKIQVARSAIARMVSEGEEKRS